MRAKGLCEIAWAQGEPSIYAREAKKTEAQPKKRKMQRAGIDYEHSDTCQVGAGDPCPPGLRPHPRLKQAPA